MLQQVHKMMLFKYKKVEQGLITLYKDNNQDKHNANITDRR